MSHSSEGLHSRLIRQSSLSLLPECVQLIALGVNNAKTIPSLVNISSAPSRLTSIDRIRIQLPPVPAWYLRIYGNTAFGYNYRSRDLTTLLHNAISKVLRHWTPLVLSHGLSLPLVYVEIRHLGCSSTFYKGQVKPSTIFRYV